MVYSFYWSLLSESVLLTLGPNSSGLCGRRFFSSYFLLSLLYVIRLTTTLLVIIFFTSPKSYATNDTLRQVNFGLEMNYSFSNPEVVGLERRFGVVPNSKGWGGHGFIEFHLLREMRFSTGIGVNSLSYSNLINRDFNANLPQPDTILHINHHVLSSKEFLVSSKFIARFDYILSPKVYLLVGVQPQWRISSKELNSYLSTDIVREIDDEREFVESIVLSNPSSAPTYREKAFSLRGDIGVGIEIKNIAIEFSYNNLLINKLPFQYFSLGFRYKI